jgi:hypothetical protein
LVDHWLFPNIFVRVLVTQNDGSDRTQGFE